MKQSYFKIGGLLTIVFLLSLAIGCKKDKIEVTEETVYREQRDPAVQYGPFDGGWQLTLKTDGVADVLPGGDIVYSGTYKISGSKITVKTEQNNETYTFEIISKEEIKEKAYGTILKLRLKV